MATQRLYNLARMTTSTTGTGTMTLGSAVAGFLSFAGAGVSDGETVTYAITDGSNSEVGRGVYTSSGTTLSRATILTSTNSGSAINLSGSAQVMITVAAEDFNTIPQGILQTSTAVNDTLTLRARDVDGSSWVNFVVLTAANTPTATIGGTGTGVTVTALNTGLKIEDTNASHALTIAAGSDLTANRTLTLTTGDASRTLTLSADVTLTGSPVEQGLHTIWVPAGAMVARTTNGAASGTVEMTTNKNMFKTLDFDTTTQEFAQFSIRMPKSWDEGTVTFAPIWSHASTATDFGVVWGLAGVATSDDDAGDVAFGTAQTSTDTGGTTNDIYQGPTSSAITIAGTPAAGDLVMFQIARNPSDGSDTMAIDARLHGVTIFYTVNAATDT